MNDLEVISFIFIKESILISFMLAIEVPYSVSMIPFQYFNRCRGGGGIFMLNIMKK